MYENAAKQRLTLQARKQPPGTDETAFRYAVADGVGVYYWVDDQCAYALTGNLDRAQLLADRPAGVRAAQYPGRSSAAVSASRTSYNAAVPGRHRPGPLSRS